MALNDCLHAVREFHQAIGAAVSAEPKLLDHRPDLTAQVAQAVRLASALSRASAQHGDDLLARAAMQLEEFAEWLEAHTAKDAEAAADAWGDRLYVLLGDAVAAGLPAREIFAEVHRSNMTKVTSRRGADGKAIKGTKFERPQFDLNPRCGATAAENTTLADRILDEPSWRVRLYHVDGDLAPLPAKGESVFGLQLTCLADESVAAVDEPDAAARIYFDVVSQYRHGVLQELNAPRAVRDHFASPAAVATQLKTITLPGNWFILDNDVETWLIAVDGDFDQT